MKLSHICLLLLAFCLPAAAQEIETGHGLFCDTQEQVHQFVTLAESGKDDALQTVNAESTRLMTACARLVNCNT